MFLSTSAGVESSDRLREGGAEWRRKALKSGFEWSVHEDLGNDHGSAERSRLHLHYLMMRRGLLWTWVRPGGGICPEDRRLKALLLHAAFINVENPGMI